MTLAVILGASHSSRGLDAQVRPSAGEAIETIQIGPNVYVIFGAGGNIVMHVGAEGVILVDAGSAAMADQVIAEVRKITSDPIRLIINTSADADHVGGNERIARAGVNLNPNAFNSGDRAAGVLAHENVLNRISAPTGQQAPYPVGIWPTETYISRIKSMYLNDEGIQVIHQPAAHSDGDSIVFFRRADVVVTGDILDLRGFPVIDAAGRRHRPGRARRPQRAPRSGDSGDAPDLQARTHLPRPGPRADCRSCGGRGVPGHGHGHPRQDPEHGRQGDDARTGKGRQPDAGVPRALRFRHGSLDDRHVR